MHTYAKFGLLAVAIIGTLAWLAVGGVSESKAYYKTIAEVEKMGSESMGKRLRIAGDVEQGSIKRVGKEVHFTLCQKPEHEGKKEGATRRLNVVYNGSDPLPDTFKDNSQALADGKMATDGTFHAQRIQAKCASKYEAKPEQLKPGQQPLNQGVPRPSGVS